MCYIDMEDEVKQCLVLKFMVQPIVENYFIHGIRMEESDNEIRIYARCVEEDLYIHVEDNGRGMPGKDMESKNRELRNNEMDTRKSIGVQAAGCLWGYMRCAFRGRQAPGHACDIEIEGQGEGNR